MNGVIVSVVIHACTHASNIRIQNEWQCQEYTHLNTDKGSELYAWDPVSHIFDPDLRKRECGIQALLESNLQKQKHDNIRVWGNIIMLPIISLVLDFWATLIVMKADVAYFYLCTTDYSLTGLYTWTEAATMSDSNFTEGFDEL